MPATSLQAAAEQLRATLMTAQRERPQRPALVIGPQGLECEWALYERTCMHEAVNRIRADQGLPAVAVEAICRVEQQAIGHLDYSRKFAFYCAELATTQD